MPPDLFPYFISLIIVLNLWNLYGNYRLTRFEGGLKRGMMIWAEPLSWETRQFLDSLPSSLKVKGSFIRKENKEVLIVEKPQKGYFSYLAYVDLSAPESRIEFRTSFLAIPLLSIGLVLFFIFSPNIFSTIFPISTLGFWILLVISLSIFIGLMLFEFYQAHRRLLKFLARVMSQQKSGSNTGF